MLNTFLYTGLTIIFISFTIVGAYMIYVNSQYEEYVTIYEIDKTLIMGAWFVGLFIFCFASGKTGGQLPVIWKDTVFLLCLGASIFIAIVMCGVLKIGKQEIIMYGNLLKADANIVKKTITASKTLEELKKFNHSQSVSQEIRSMEQMIKSLENIHSELQAQKVIFNASFSTKEMKSVIMADSDAVNSNILYELDKIQGHKDLTSSLSDVKKILKKYR